MKTVYKDMLKYKADLEERIKALEPYAAVHPGRNIRITSDRGRVVYRVYDSSCKTVHHLSCAESELIGSLGNKRYAEKALRILKKNLHAAEKFLQAYTGKEEWQILDSCSDVFREINNNIGLDYAAERKRWAEFQYERNPYYAAYLKHPSMRGELYRSKSESLIADSLLECSLAYIPEYPLQLKSGQILYPDFKILIPETFEIKYWEHLGLMDDPSYADKNCKRILQMERDGIIAGKNLILTFETRNYPLSKPYVMSVIKNQLL